MTPRDYSPDASWHGTLNGYKNAGCRCERCKTANKEYARAYRVKKTQSGECLDCTEKARDGAKRCEKHLAMALARWMRYAAKK